MKTLNLREAKATLSSVVRAAENGEPTTITKSGRAVAVVVPVEAATRLFSVTRPSLASLLLTIPEPIDVERDQTPMRDVEL
jgi:prevent-host-death family protein